MKDTLDWSREFARVGNWRVEKMGKAEGSKLGYLLSNEKTTYVKVNPGPFESKEERDRAALNDILTIERLGISAMHRRSR